MRLYALFLAALPIFGQWPQFRGPNGSGVAEAHNLPVEFGPEKNVVWSVDLPPGHSSPVIARGRIFLTAMDGESLTRIGRDKAADSGQGKLWTICLDQATGKTLWRSPVPRPRREQYQVTNSAASPSPVTDGQNVYVFFGDFGLLAFDWNGKEQWRLPLGPFNNMNGHGTSPILEGDLLLLLCDQDAGSFLIAVDKNTGRVRWRVERPEITRGYATPAIFHPKSGPAEVIVPGAYLLVSYAVETGEKLWWVRGMSWHPKSLPVISGDMIFVHSWETGGEVETPTETPTFEETLATYDANKDGKLSREELPERMRNSFADLDLDQDGTVDRREWDFYRARRAARNSLLAVRHGGRGDLTATNVVWSMQKFLPNVPSPLYHEGVLYIVKDGGIMTSLDPANGKILKQARLSGAPGTYYSSPVAGDGKIYAISLEGKVSVIKAGAQWEVIGVNDLGDDCLATPAIVDDRIYIRTRNRLYCFSNPQPQKEKILDGIRR
jgi:outer membrane protein assembly factor BamB